MGGVPGPKTGSLGRPRIRALSASAALFEVRTPFMAAQASNRGRTPPPTRMKNGALFQGSQRTSSWPDELLGRWRCLCDSLQFRYPPLRSCHSQTPGPGGSIQLRGNLNISRYGKVFPLARGTIRADARDGSATGRMPAGQRVVEVQLAAVDTTFLRKSTAGAYLAGTLQNVMDEIAFL